MNLWKGRKYSELISYVYNSEFKTKLLKISEVKTNYERAIGIVNKGGKVLSTPLKKKVRKLKNGIELTIYRGGKVEDYVMPRDSQFLDIRFFADDLVLDKDHSILGIKEKDVPNNDIFYKVKIKVKDEKEFVGCLDSETIKSLETLKVLPLIDGGCSSGMKLYSLINLENGNVHKMSAPYGESVLGPLSERFIKGYYSDQDDGCINLETMKTISDEKGKSIFGMAFNVNGGVFVVFTANIDDDGGFSYFRAYNTQGKFIDELKTRLDFETATGLMDLWNFGDQIVYSKGKFYKVENGKKSELDFEPAEEVNPM